MDVNINKQVTKMHCGIFVTLCLVPSVVLSIELSIVRDSNIQSYGLRKGKVDDYVSLLNFKNDVNKTGQVLAYSMQVVFSCTIEHLD